MGNLNKMVYVVRISTQKLLHLITEKGMVSFRVRVTPSWPHKKKKKKKKKKGSIKILKRKEKDTNGGGDE